MQRDEQVLLASSRALPALARIGCAYECSSTVCSSRRSQLPFRARNQKNVSATRLSERWQVHSGAGQLQNVKRYGFAIESKGTVLLHPLNIACRMSGNTTAFDVRLNSPKLSGPLPMPPLSQ